MKAICQLCDEVYGIVTLETLRYPLTGAMFTSPDSIHGIPAPFDASLTWEFFRCPYGRIHRPMIQDDIVLTDEGLVRLPKDGGPAILDAAATGEVDRSSISDRVLQVSDEDAEKTARANLTSSEPTGITEPKPITGVKLMVLCPTCGKEFDSNRKMNMHVLGAHRRRKN